VQENLYVKLNSSFDRTIVVGDIHGCLNELQQLLEKVGFTTRDVLIAVGDLVDRGPASWEVVRFFRDTPNAWSVIGNHERRVVRSVEGTSQPAWSQLQTLSRVPEAGKEELLEYLGSLPAVIQTPKVIVTHARLDPPVSIDRQNPYHVTAVGGPGVVIPLDDEGVPEWYRQWAQCYRLDTPICMGHVGYDRVELVPGGLYALDTGAVQGGQLTAVIIEEGRIVQVPVLRNYLHEARQEWFEQQYAEADPWKIPFSMIKDLLKHDSPIPPLQAALDHFFSAFEQLEFELRIERIRERVIDVYGEPPESGLERGNVFRTIAAELPLGVARVVRFALSRHPRTAESMMNIFKGERHLAEVATLLQQAEIFLFPTNREGKKRGGQVNALYSI
jgi:hypothetical protein